MSYFLKIQKTFSWGFLITIFLIGFGITTLPVFAATITVNTTADEVNSNGNCSFREAMQSAENNAVVDNCVAGSGDDTINLTGLTGTIFVSNNDRTVTQGLTILGPGTGVLTLNGMSSANITSRLLTFSPGSDTKILNISNISITEFGDGAGAGGINGGILITHGIANIDNTAFSSNFAADSGAFLEVSTPAELHVTNSSFSEGFGQNGGAITTNAATLTVDNSTFINCAATNGGAVYVNGGTTTITNSVFNGNWFAFGSGIHVTNSGNATVTGSTFVGSAFGSFGVIYVDTGSTFTMTNGSITNSPNYEAGTSAIENHGTANITNVLIDSNTGDYTVFNAGTMTLQGVTLSNTIGESSGFYVAAIGIEQSTGTLTIRQSRITHNQEPGYEGAAIYQFGGTITIDQSTIDDNIARHKGAALFISPLNEITTTNIINSTIANNSAPDDAGGIYMEQPGAFSPTLNLYNTTLSGNTTTSASNGGNLTIAGGTVTSVNTLFVKTGTGKNCSGVGTVTDNGDNIQFGDSTCGGGFTTALTNPLGSNTLADNGGSVLTIALSLGSSAIDAGNNSVCSDLGTVNNMDQRGELRPVDGDSNGSAVCDVGAFEYQLPDTTPPTVENITSSKTNGTYTIGEVIPLQITLSEVVTVTGTPHITLETGASDAVVNYSSGSGTATLTFNYTVSANQNSLDLDYADTNALSLNGGTIKDAALNDADLTLPVPGAAGSLGSNKNIVIDTTSPVVTEVTPVSTPTNDNTPNYTFSTTEGGTITYGGDCLSATGSATGGSNTITFNTLNDGTHNNCTIKVTDAVTNQSNTLNVTSFVVDTTPPNLTVVSEVAPNPTTDTTPTYTFNSDENGLIHYDVACPVVVSPADGSPVLSGDIPVTFGPLADAIYTGCKITVTDAANNTSSQLTIGDFEVNTSGGGGGTDTTAPIIEEITPVTTPTNDATPGYVFSSDEVGTISYGGSCISNSTSAIASNNSITFNTLPDGTYSDCTITVTDASDNVSNTINVTPFTIDTEAPVVATVTAVPSLTNDNTPAYVFSSTEEGTITYGGACTSGTTDANSGSNTVTFNTLTDGLHDNCTVKVTDSAGNQSNVHALASFTFDTVAPVLEMVIDVTPNPTTDMTPTITFSSTEEGTISYNVDCPNPSPLENSIIGTGDHEVTFSVPGIGIFSNCEMTLTDAANNESIPLQVDTFRVIATPSENNNVNVTHGSGGSVITVEYPIRQSGMNGKTPPLPQVVINRQKDLKFSTDKKNGGKPPIECNVKGYTEELSKELQQIKPAGNITRGEFITILIKCQYGPQGKITKSTFRDVPATHRAAPYIEKGFQAGIVQGYPDGTFKPDNNTNVAEAMKMILLSTSKVSREKISTSKANVSCGNLNQSEWFAKFLNFANNEKLTLEMFDNDGNRIQTCSPADYITRGQVAKILITFTK